MIDVKASIALTDNFAELGVKKIFRGLKGIPYATTHGCRSIRRPDPDIKVHESRMMVGHFVIQILVSRLTALLGLKRFSIYMRSGSIGPTELSRFVRVAGVRQTKWSPLQVIVDATTSSLEMHAMK